MFYSQFILAKKGPLGTIWIAAHLERKLRKNQVTETNIGVSVDSILFPEVPIALRLSGHLLLGVVRIYSRKVNYLFHDCSEALVKIKQAFHSGAVDLPPEAATAPFHSITLPENFDFDDLELLPDREAVFLANCSVDHHVTSREQITLQDTVDDSAYLSTQFGLDERLDATRLEFDEDELPAKPVEQEEENLMLEEDALPAVEENEDDDRNLHGLVPGNTDEERIPDLNEEQPPEELQQPEINNDGLDINVVPETEADVPTVSIPRELEAAEKEAVGEDMEVESSVSKPGLREGSPEAGIDEPPVQQAEPPAASLETPTLETPTEAEPHPGEDDKDEGLEKIQENGDKIQSPSERSTDGEAEVKAAEEQLQDVPEIEKLRSAADVDPEASMLDIAIPESARKVDDASAQSSLEQDALKVQDAQETPLLKQDDAPSAIRTSPPSIDFGGDDDVLASILGRRSLKVAPTPEVPPSKRHKPAPKPGSKKRKAQLDEATVLHGDDMRQQLSDTRDIRRVRKRAPCTEYEIWNSEKEVQGQHIFDEPLVLGFRNHIRQIYRCIYSVGEVKASVDSEPAELSGRQKHQLDCEETEEAITLQEELLDDYDPLYDSQRLYRFEEELEEHTPAEQLDCRADVPGTPPSKQTEEVQQQADEKKEEETAGVVNEERTDPLPDDLMSTAEAAPEAPVPEEAAESAASAEHTTGSEHASYNDQMTAKETAMKEAEVTEEGQAEEPVEADVVAENSQRTLETEEDIAGVAVEDKLIEEEEKSTHAQTVEEVPADIAIHTELEQADEVPADNAIHTELEQAEDHGKDQGGDQDKDQTDDQDNNDLVFLTDAKDEEGDDVDNRGAEYPESQVQDNSGWSVRTRAVCQYLRMTFEGMEGPRRDKAGGGAAKLGLERLLQGKRRRECARMFFESLVLKTKDYINVEQSAPFDNIYISARAKLMKADFM